MAARRKAPRPARERKHPDRDAKSPARPASGQTTAPNARNHPDRDALASLVRDRRRGESLTQRGLAELAGVAPRVVWELEHGKPTMRMDVVDRVLRVFGLMLGAIERPRPELDE